MLARRLSGLSRRRFLQGLGAAALAGLGERLAGGASPAVAAAPAATGPVFAHGVASGDPLRDRVMLWTRVTPPAGQTGPIEVSWKVARDPGMTDVVRSGTADATANRDWTVKVDATGLAPGRTYHYRFVAAGRRSPTGRTRTASVGSPDRVRLAVVTCGDYSRGLFNAYARVAERDDLDAVVHLGDYIYETDRNAVRRHEPPVDLVTLAQYRARYASYRLDPALAKLHRRHPMIWVWDDHETVDGTWMLGADPKDHDPAEHGSFTARKLAARQAALEWLPIRSPDPANLERIYRRFAFGDLVDLIMLDTRRIGRDRQGEGNVQGEFFRQTGEFADPSRHILGAKQEAWLIDALQSSGAAWRLLGNQVVLSQIKVVGAPDATNASVYANPDQWDGYAPARDRVFDAIEDGDVRDLVVLTGDVHASMAFEVTRDPNNPAAYNPVTSRGALAVEFVAPSISSAGDPRQIQPDELDNAVEQLIIEGDQALRAPNPHLKYIEAKLNGYMLVDVNRERVRAEFWLVPRVGAPTDKQRLDQVFVVPRGEARLVAGGREAPDGSEDERDPTKRERSPDDPRRGGADGRDGAGDGAADRPREAPAGERRAASSDGDLPFTGFEAAAAAGAGAAAAGAGYALRRAAKRPEEPPPDQTGRDGE